MGQTLRVDDFSGGKSDNYINGPLNRAKEMDNFLITKNKKPSTRWGSELYDADLYQTPAGNQRTGNINYFESVLFERTARSIYYRLSGSWEHLVGPVDSNLAFGAGTVASHVAFMPWQKHLYATTDTYSTPRKIYHDGSDWQVRTAGLPKLASDPTITPEADDAKTYIYFFHYQYDYTVGTVDHIDRGSVTQILVTAAGDFSGAGHYNDISVIPVISNGSTECYETDTIKVKIYRTEDAGTIGKYVGEVTNGTTTFEDQVADADLGEVIYITGGVVDNDPPPLAKYVIAANDIAWYLNVKEGAEERGYRVRQSLQFDLDSCPESFFTDMDDDITGGGNVDIYPIIFTKHGTTRLENYVDSLGRGFTRKRVVSDTVGCISHNGIVALEHGLFFPAADGFYFTNGFKVQKLSQHLDESYKNYVASDTQARKIYGKRDRNSGRVYWTIQSDAAGTDCDIIYILDPYWGIVNESSFTTWSAGANMAPTALEFVDTELVRADTRGYSFIHKETLYEDPTINTLVTPDNWSTSSVIYDYTSCAMAFGSELTKKWITKLLTICKNLTNLSLQPKSVNDDQGSGVELKEIRFRDNVVWGDETIDWDDPDIIWNYSGLITGLRRFPKRGLRCIYKQVRYTNSETVIIKSDDYGTATTDGLANTVLLDDAATYDWPTDSVGYSIYLSDDNYSRAYPVAVRSADTLTVTDSADALPTGAGKEWMLKGFRRGERFELEGYSIDYNMFGESHTTYQSGDDGANAQA